MKTLAEQRALVSRLNLMDDLFFHKVAEDKSACEEMLRIILKKPDLTVKECQPQRFLRNVDAHSVVLDVLCTDESGRLFNIEVQKKTMMIISAGYAFIFLISTHLLWKKVFLIRIFPMSVRYLSQSLICLR